MGTPSPRITRVSIQRGFTGVQSLSLPEGLEGTWLTQGCVLENGSHHGKSGQSYILRSGEGIGSLPFPRANS